MLQDMSMPNNAMMQNNLQNNIQYGVLNRLTTGNPLVDSLSYVIVSMFMATVVSGFLTWMTDTFKYLTGRLSAMVSYLYNRLWMFIDRVLNRQKFMTKSIDISYITEEKKVNQLYKALDWYLASKHEIDYIRETPLRFSFEDEIEGGLIPKEIKINKRPTMNNFKSLKFEGYEIFFITNKDVITVYTDKERKRENYKITLTTKIPLDTTEDILDKFCTFCLNEYIKSKTNRQWMQLIYTNKNGRWENTPSNNARKLETIVLQDNMTEDIKEDLDDFVNSETWYHEWGIPYTRGYLFYGKPGCGKTSLIKGISNYTQRHMYYLMLNHVKSDNELIDLLKGIDYKKAILVIEDIDCMTKIINDRSNRDSSEDMSELKSEIKAIKQTMMNGNMNRTDIFMQAHPQLFNDGPEQKTYNGELTLSGILNAIDGIFNNDGRIMIMTSNHPEVLDRALIRSGRVDRKIKFDYCTKEQIQHMYKMMFKKEVELEELNHINDYKYSPADIVSLFVRYKSDPLMALKDIENKIKVDDSLLFA